MRKNTLSSGEVTVIVNHDFVSAATQENLVNVDDENVPDKKQKHITVTNIFRCCSRSFLAKNCVTAGLLNLQQYLE